MPASHPRHSKLRLTCTVNPDQSKSIELTLPGVKSIILPGPIDFTVLIDDALLLRIAEARANGDEFVRLNPALDAHWALHKTKANQHLMPFLSKAKAHVMQHGVRFVSYTEKGDCVASATLTDPTLTAAYNQIIECARNQTHTALELPIR